MAVSLSSTSVLPSHAALQNLSEGGCSGCLAPFLLPGGSGSGAAQAKAFRVVQTRCSAGSLRQSQPPTSTTNPVNYSWTFKLASSLVDAVLSIKPLYGLMTAQAKRMIRERGEKIGVQWLPRLEELQKHDWEAEFKRVNRDDVQYPKYYLSSFHSYPEGNMTWDAALESVLAAQSVHATVFSKDTKDLEADGDKRLRLSYHEKMIPMLQITPKDILDIGCSSGLSTFALHDDFPEAKITGVDLSPYFLAFASYNLRALEAKRGGKNIPIEFIHAAAENTKLPSESFDLVSVCLCFHELPTEPSEKIIKEAYRVLRSGGSLAIMDMNPASEGFQRMVQNPLLFSVFKSTEPFISEFANFPFVQVLENTGFHVASYDLNSPRHRTIVAHKL